MYRGAWDFLKNDQDTRFLVLKKSAGKHFLGKKYPELFLLEKNEFTPN